MFSILKTNMFPKLEIVSYQICSTRMLQVRFNPRIDQIVLCHSKVMLKVRCNLKI